MGFSNFDLQYAKNECPSRAALAQELRADRQPEFTQIEAWAPDLKIEGSMNRCIPNDPNGTFT